MEIESRKFECKHEIVRQGMKTTVEINDGNVQGLAHAVEEVIPHT